MSAFFIFSALLLLSGPVDFYRAVKSYWDCDAASMSIVYITVILFQITIAMLYLSGTVMLRRVTTTVYFIAASIHIMAVMDQGSPAGHGLVPSYLEPSWLTPRLWNGFFVCLNGFLIGNIWARRDSVK